MLEVADLEAFYGKSRILAGVDLTIGAGEIVTLLGRNGTGRSTLAGAIMGLVTRTGSVRVNGRETVRLKPHQLAGAGVALVPEGREVFATLTVDENLRLPHSPRGRSPIWSIAEIYERFPALARRKDVDAGALSGGEKQILSICRSLMTAPSCLLVDEPTEGLAPQIVAQVADILGAIAATGVGVLLIEQKQAIALDVADRIAVLGKGEIVFTGAPDEFAKAEEIRTNWLGV